MSELTSEGFFEEPLLADSTELARAPRVPEDCALLLLLLLEEEDAVFETTAGSSSFSFSFLPPKRVLIPGRFLNESFTLDAIEEPAEVIEFVMVFMMFLGFFGGILVCGSIMVIPATRPLYMS